MNQRIKRNQLPCSDSQLCEYGDIGDATELQIRYREANRQAEYGIRFDEWLETDEDAANLVSRAWDALDVQRQLFIVMELHGEYLRNIEQMLTCVKEITCGS